MLVALSSELIIVFHLQGASSRNLGRTGSKERAVHHLLQRLLLLRFWMDRCNTMKQMTELRNMSGKLDDPARRTCGPERADCEPQGISLPYGGGFCQFLDGG
jgi:hypothetical protein